MIAQATLVDWSQVATWFTRYGQALLVGATFLLVVANFLLWRSTKKAAQIAKASHTLAARLAQLQMQPAFSVEVEETEPPATVYLQGRHMHDFKARPAIDRFRGLKVTNVGRGPALVHKVVYADKEDCGPTGMEQGLLIYSGMLARFDLKQLKSLFLRGSRDVDCRLEYSDFADPPKTHVYRFRLRIPDESGASVLVIPVAM